MSRREIGWYWVKWGDDWRPAFYDTVLQSAPWWVDDTCYCEDDFNEIGPRIPTPGEPAPAPYGWACENRSRASGLLLGTRFVIGGKPERLGPWFPLWRIAALEPVQECQAALELALQVAGSSLDQHLSPADALNWLVEHHKAEARAEVSQ